MVLHYNQGFLKELSTPIYFPLDRSSCGYVIAKLIPFERVLVSLPHSTNYYIEIKSGVLSSEETLK